MNSVSNCERQSLSLRLLSHSVSLCYASCDPVSLKSWSLEGWKLKHREFAGVQDGLETRNDSPLLTAGHEWRLLFPPALILQPSESIHGKFVGVETLQETEPWGLPQNHFHFQGGGLWSRDCSGWNVPCVFLYIMIPARLAPGNVWSQMEFSIEFNLCASQRALGTPSSVAYGERVMEYGCFILIFAAPGSGPQIEKEEKGAWCIRSSLVEFQVLHNWIPWMLIEHQHRRGLYWLCVHLFIPTLWLKMSLAKVKPRNIYLKYIKKKNCGEWSPGPTHTWCFQS